MSHVRHPELGGPGLMGNAPISMAARERAARVAYDDLEVGEGLSWAQVLMVVDYAATRFERGEVGPRNAGGGATAGGSTAGALDTLMSGLGVDLTGAYRLAAVLHAGPDPDCEVCHGDGVAYEQRFTSPNREERYVPVDCPRCLR